MADYSIEVSIPTVGPGGLPEAPEDSIIYGRRDREWVNMTAPANLQIRRGTAAEVAAITPLQGEPVWATDTKQLVVGDGITAGGIQVGVQALQGVYVFKTADQSTSLGTSDGGSDALQSDNTLTFATEENAMYSVELGIIATQSEEDTSPPQPLEEAGFVGKIAATNATVFGFWQPTFSAVNPAPLTRATIIFSGDGDGTSHLGHPDTGAFTAFMLQSFSVLGGNSAGSITFQFGGGFVPPTGATTTVKKGSWLRYTKLTSQ
jgi:hypothetical protein